MNEAPRRRGAARWKSQRGVIPLALLLLASASPLACRGESTSKARKAVATNPAELERSAAGARRALNELKPRLGALNAALAELHRQYDPLPPGLPGFGETRAKFYATAEGIGMMNASMPWLASRIDSAMKSGDGAELTAIARDISQKQDEMRQAERINLELAHEVLPFEHQVEDFVLGKSTCE